MSAAEMAIFGLGFGALILAAVFISREFVLDGREHRAANQRIKEAHLPVLVQAQAWQQSAGAGTTEFPAPRVQVVAEYGEGLAEWAPTGGVAKHAAQRRPIVPARIAGLFTRAGEWVRVQLGARNSVGPVEGDTERLPNPEQTVARIFAQHAYRAQGAAAVDRPFDERIHDQNDVLHGRMQAAANDEPTTLIPTVAPDGAR